MNQLYLNQNLLKPGDILLTRPRTWISRIIAFSTFGNYSHAALILGQNAAFESTGFGIGYSFFNINRVEIKENNNICLSHLHNVEAAVVLRHPDFNYTFNELLAITTEFFGCSYPQLVKLAKAFSSFYVFQVPIGLFLGIIDFICRNKKTRNSGPFCSQLVSLIYDNINCPIFRTKRSPETVSPNSLKRSLFFGSKLKIVQGAICLPDYSAKLNEELRIKLAKSDLDLTKYTKTYVLAKDTIVDLSPKIEEFRDNIRRLKKSLNI